MSCGSASCSQSQVLAVPVLALARPRFLDIPWRDRLRAARAIPWRLEYRRSQRLAPAGPDDRLLADIGPTRAQARREAAQPFRR